ncbi:class II aldolase/adducin family protein [Clostridium aminobutyricum]|uniref:Class II aldolase/adducin family protein n=1 Tax=Clostridium aminobutyricum TaxID=33953 RepID=A0A939D8Y8_CLOAM|nr:class II aldolase/adducin family protein [Clostridium aminobutyricum]MBN7773371.1 class II aldolase/adducin family protein [Clostridium aminobutyricum]
MKMNTLNPAQQLCLVMSRIYDAKLTTVSGGNLSLKDKEGNIWVTPSGGDKGRYQASDMLKICPDGTIEGKRKASMETGIHRSILMDRPEFTAIVHAHPPALVAISLMHQLPETAMLPWIAQQVKGIRLAGYGCPGTEALRAAVARAFQTDINTAILANHGAFIASEKGLSDAFAIFQNLDVSVRIQAKAASLTGQMPHLISKEKLDDYHSAKAPQFEALAVGERTQKEREVRKSILDLAGRAYNRDFLTSSVGVISARVEEDLFVITVSGADNASLGDEDLVLVKGYMAEKGKTPAKSALLHQKIYEENPEIQSIIMAAPPNAMVFAVTDLDYDVRTIPECYIVLREMKKFPFGSTINGQKELAAYLGPNSPVAIVENDCFICTGSSVFNAFDRLEVAEFSAEAVWNVKLLGGHPISITENQIIDLKKNFGII